MLLFAVVLKTILGYTKPLNVYKKLFFTTLSLFILGFVISSIFLMRGSNSLNISDRTEQFKENITNPIVKEAIITQILGIIPNYSITSNVMNIVPQKEDYKYGMTYLHDFYELLPRILTRDYNSNMSEWFKRYYAPQVTGAFGFAMEAEGYVNFGYFGFIVFAVWGAALTFAYYRFINKPFLPGEAFFIYYSLLAVFFL